MYQQTFTYTIASHFQYTHTGNTASHSCHKVVDLQLVGFVGPKVLIITVKCFLQL